MAANYVVVRLPGAGTLLGEAVARHPGALVTCVLAGSHQHGGRAIVDHMALVEGLPDSEIAGVLLAWSRRHGESPQVIGGLFALRLPVALDAEHTATVSTCLAIGREIPEVTHLLHDGVLELWGRCGTPSEARRVKAKLEETLAGADVLSISIEEPHHEDVECWALLRTAAASVVPDCLVVAT